ncbi:serine/threonine-protein phosphatase 1 family protein [Bordetella bronchiseptica B18-5 (C3)]|uniref:metallophosphoesterase n=1 Tax=Bordetella bronchiseptica TaxID=518 RepID=UPI000461D16B|nr:metallophosphoesterase [Bordetella bronchiseptica]KDB64052.1 serine/threonine-protein phosphatase 1 family protein [Bordetella bronchiseptica B18-5 (C3)]KDD88954.1 serine/threonine-protein phosphatase 1 family protein [Bordetella bronchiseptica MBORD762]
MFPNLQYPAFLRLPRNPAGRDFAVGDIHGHFSRLEQALDECGFDPRRDRLFSVGDLIDRGPDSEAAVQWLAHPWFYAVQGNHEDYAIRHVRTGLVDQDNWRSYGGGWFLDAAPERQRAWAGAFAALPVVIEVATQAGPVGLLHADCPVRDWSRLEYFLQARPKRARSVCQWSRERLASGDARGVDGIRAVVAGHTPVSEPVVLGNVYHIDTQGWRPHGYFTLLDLSTLSAWPRPAQAGAPAARG